MTYAALNGHSIFDITLSQLPLMSPDYWCSSFLVILVYSEIVS